jgi:glutamine synthetase
MDIGEVKEICKQHDVHTVECSFPDAHGFPRGKRIPVRHFFDRAHQGFDIANAALVWDRKCDVLPEVAYANWNTGYPDMKAVPDLTTFRPIPWRPGAASVLCDCLEEDGSEVRVYTRHLLKSIVADAQAMGYEPMVGSELEFYILDQSDVPLYPEIDCYSLTKGAELERLLERVRRELDDFGITIEACNTEYGPAQVEVNIRYADAVRTADHTMLFKMAVKEIAAQEGYRVTFMAKLFSDQSGSGYHVHQSLSETSGGKNAFADAKHSPEDSPLMRSYLAGLMLNFAAFTAVGEPTVNAYRRTKDYTFAPLNVSWGIDNRTVGVRALVGHGPATRLEWRNGSADANPYLIIAANLAAGLEGIRQGLEPPPMVEGDAYARHDLPPLPKTLEEALDVLETHELAHKLLGDFLDVFLVLGRHEIAVWQSEVTEWERQRYFDA